MSTQTPHDEGREPLRYRRVRWLSSWPSNWLPRWVVGGVLTGFVALALLSPSAWADFGPQDEQRIAEAVRADGVWIDPAWATAHGVDAADERRITEAVAAATDRPVRVILLEVPSGDPFGGRGDLLARWMHDVIGGPALYVTANAYDNALTVENSLDEGYSDYEAARVAAADHPEDVAEQVVATVGLLQLPRGELEDRYREIRTSEVEAGKEPDGPGLWLVLGLVAAGLVVLAGLHLGWRRWQHRRRGLTLPTRAVRAVAGAREEAGRDRARQEVARLGEALGNLTDDLTDGLTPREQKDPATEHARAALQSALDHYAAATTLLDRATGGLRGRADLVGVLVLARRGEDARAASETTLEEPWQAPVPCWINPLHDWAAGDVTVTRGRTEQSVPACAQCAAASDPDALLLRDGKDLAPWYTLDLGVWSRTAFGATAPDLPATLERR